MNWIACAERMPETGPGYGEAEQSVEVLVSDQDGLMIVAHLFRWNTDEEFHWRDGPGDTRLDLNEVTHWMPLPAPPVCGQRHPGSFTMTCNLAPHADPWHEATTDSIRVRWCETETVVRHDATWTVMYRGVMGTTS